MCALALFIRAVVFVPRSLVFYAHAGWCLRHIRSLVFYAHSGWCLRHMRSLAYGRLLHGWSFGRLDDRTIGRLGDWAVGRLGRLLGEFVVVVGSVA